MSKVLNIRLSEDISTRLDILAEKTQRPKSFYVKEILSRYLGEYEDAYLSLERLNDKNSRYYRTEEVEKSLGL